MQNRRPTWFVFALLAGTIAMFTACASVSPSTSKVDRTAHNALDRDRGR